MSEHIPSPPSANQALRYGRTVLAYLAELPDMRYVSMLGEPDTQSATNDPSREMTGPDNHGQYDSTPDVEPDVEID